MSRSDPLRNASPTAGRVFLVRHGRTALNADGRLRGRLDPPLDDTGEAEVAALARRLAEHRIVRILTSPLTRAVQTARAIGDATWLPVTALSGLLDRDYGPWAGELETEVIDRFGCLDEAPEIEPLTAVQARALAVLDGQLPVLEHGDVVLVSHDAVLKALLAALDPSLGSNLRQRTACWNVLLPDPSGWRIAVVDQVAEDDLMAEVEVPTAEPAAKLGETAHPGRDRPPSSAKLSSGTDRGRYPP